MCVDVYLYWHFNLTIFSMLLQKHKNTMFFSNKMLQLCLNKNEIIVNKL